MVAFEPHQDDTSNYRYRSIIRLSQFTGDGTSKTLKFQFKTTDSQLVARIKNISIIAIKAESGDLFHEDTVQRTTTSSTYVEYDTYTPATGDYYVISSAPVSNTAGSGVAVSGARLQFNGADLAVAEEGVENDDKYIPLCAVARISGDGVKTLDWDHKVIASTNTSTAEWQALLLDRSTFEDEDFSNDITDTSTTSTSYVSHDSVTINDGGNTEDWLLLAGWAAEVNSTSSAGGVSTRVQVDGVTVQEAIGVVGNATFDAFLGAAAAVYTGDGASAVLDMYVKGKNAATNVLEADDGGSWLIAAQMGGGSATQNLTPSAISVTPTFYAPTITTGSVNVSPSLLTVTPTFYNPTVTSAVTVTASLLSVSPTFYAPTVTTGAVTVTASLLTVTPTFYNPTVSQPSAPQNLTVGALFTVTPTFYSPAVAMTVAPSLLTVTPTFYAPTVTTGAVTLSPSLISVSPTFHAPTVTGGQTLTADLLTVTPTFYTPTVTVGDATIHVSVLAVTPTFYGPRVSRNFVIVDWGIPRRDWSEGPGEADWSGSINEKDWVSTRPSASWIADRPSQ
jgi:hypothetical protein